MNRHLAALRLGRGLIPRPGAPPGIRCRKRAYTPHSASWSNCGPPAEIPEWLATHHLPAWRTDAS